MNENFNIRGRLKIDQYRGGELIHKGDWIENIITNAGKAHLATHLIGTEMAQYFVRQVGFGTGTTEPSVTDTALTSELNLPGYNRTSVQRSNPVPNVIQYVATLNGLLSPFTIQEAGLFSAGSGGILIAHQLTGAVTLSVPSDSLQISWQIIFN